MKEIINSILDSTKDRLKNPILGSFVFSWVIFNWKAIFYILLSEQPIERKIKYTEENFSNIYNNFWFPLYFSTFYILFFPYILWLFDQISSKAIVGRKMSALKLNISDIQNKQKIAIEESELENLRASYRDKADLNKKIEILTSQLNDKTEIIESLNDELKEIREQQSKVKDFLSENSEITFTEKEQSEYLLLYKNFKDSDIFDFFKEIGSEISRRNALPKNIDDLVVEKYKHSGIIIEHKDEENERIYYKLTRKGQFFWGRFLNNIIITKKNKVLKDPDDLPF